MIKKTVIQGKDVSIELERGNIVLKGFLKIPKNAKTIVIFVHGSGSGRFSPRNQFVADYLVENDIATLLLDLLTEEEEAIDVETAEYRFDIPLLAKRTVGTADWVSRFEETKDLNIAYFGASTGAAAALIAAAEQGKKINSVVSRGGRPDLAIPVLGDVVSPTMLIVGGNDFGVIELNQQAYSHLNCEKSFEIVPGATHLFEESGKLQEVARLAAGWFKKHL